MTLPLINNTPLITDGGVTESKLNDEMDNIASRLDASFMSFF